MPNKKLQFEDILEAFSEGKSVKITYVDQHGQVTTKILSDSSVSKTLVMQEIDKTGTKIEIVKEI